MLKAILALLAISFCTVLTSQSSANYSIVSKEKNKSFSITEWELSLFRPHPMVDLILLSEKVDNPLEINASTCSMLNVTLLNPIKSELLAVEIFMQPTLYLYNYGVDLTPSLDLAYVANSNRHSIETMSQELSLGIAVKFRKLSLEYVFSELLPAFNSINVLTSYGVLELDLSF